MKTSDIILGEEYAYASDYEWKGYRGRDGLRARRGKVVAVRVKRTVQRDWSTGSARDGVQIIPLGDDGTPSGKSIVLRPAEVRMPWLEYGTLRAAEDVKQSELRRERDARFESIHSRITTVLPDDFDTKGYVPQRFHDGTHSIRPQIGTWESLITLLEAVHDHGKTAGFREAQEGQA